MKKIVHLTGLTILLTYLFLPNSTKAYFDNEIQKLFQKSEPELEAQLLPSPEGIGGVGSYFGHQMAIDGNRAMVAADIGDFGSVFYLEHDGKEWQIIQRLEVTGLENNHKLGSDISLSGNRAVIGGTNGYYADNIGTAFVFDFDGNTWQETAKLTPSDGITGDYFGNSVSVSGDRIIIGSQFANMKGEVYVFELENNEWVEKTKLNNSNSTIWSEFGSSIHLEGDTAFVGAPYNGNEGAVFVFRNTLGVWDDGTILTGSDMNPQELFGRDISVSGNKMLIGSPNNYDNTGSAYVFEFDDNTWSETSILTTDDPIIQRKFGESVSISGDRALIGAYHIYFEDSDPGSAYLYEFNNQVWTESAKFSNGEQNFGTAVALSNDHVLVADAWINNNSGIVYEYAFDGQDWLNSETIVIEPGAPYTNFGKSVSMSSQWTIVGAPKQNIFGLDTGKGEVHVYKNQTNAWAQEVILSASDGHSGDSFGFSVSIFGNTALIGAPFTNEHTGAAYIFEYNGTSWIEVAKLTPDDATINDQFGWSVSLNNNMALIGAPRTGISRTDGSKYSGAAYVFEYNGTSWVESSQFTGEENNSFFGFSVSLNNNRALVGAFGTDNFTGAAYVYENDQLGWYQSAKLTHNNAQENHYFGISVSIQNNTALIAAQWFDSDGAVFVFDFDEDTWNESQKLTPSAVTDEGVFGTEVQISGNNVVVTRANISNNSNSHTVYLYERFDSTWQEKSKIVALDMKSSDNFGGSTFIFGDTLLVGSSGADFHGTNSGAANIYKLSDFSDLIYRHGFE